MILVGIDVAKDKQLHLEYNSSYLTKLLYLFINFIYRFSIFIN